MKQYPFIQFNSVPTQSELAELLKQRAKDRRPAIRAAMASKSSLRDLWTSMGFGCSERVRPGPLIETD